MIDLEIKRAATEVEIAPIDQNKGFYRRIFSTYDFAFIANLSLMNISGAFYILYSITLQEMLKTQYKLTPD